MVDIGSLVYFGNAISQKFQREVLLISNINLLTLLEVAEKSFMNRRRLSIYYQS